MVKGRRQSKLGWDNKPVTLFVKINVVRYMEGDKDSDVELLVMISYFTI